MENVTPSLLLNYERKNGKKWPFNVLDIGINHTLFTGSVRRLEELLVPSAGRDSNNALTAISNAIYIEARRHNMSLSNFGHLDPVKFCIAAGYLLLMMAEIKRDLGIALEYAFNSTFYGKTLAQAAGFQLNDAIANYPSYAVKYNQLAARISNLMIPELKLFQKWLTHRINVYKDDEGERFSIYLYHMYNYYQLDVDPNSPTVGQLLFKRVEVSANGGIQIPTISSLLNLVDTILLSYESDDDMVQFATEAVKAGISHFVVDPIPSTPEAFAKVKLNLIYDLDDVLSQENARWIKPLTGAGTFSLVGSRTVNFVASWDIVESNDTFRVGAYSSDFSGSTVVNYDILPIVIPNAVTVSGSAGSDIGNPTVDKFPIVTHSKITSVDGLDSLTRYIAGAERLDGGFDSFAAVATGTLSVNDVAETSHTLAQCAAATAGTNQILYGLTCHGTEMLLGEMVFVAPVTNNGVSYDTHYVPNIWFNYICAKPTRVTSFDGNQAVSIIAVANLGFKAGRIAYAKRQYGTNYFTFCIGHDFDYVTSVNQDDLNNFFECMAWNYCQLGTVSMKFGDKSDFKGKFKSKKNRKGKKDPSEEGK